MYNWSPCIICINLPNLLKSTKLFGTWLNRFTTVWPIIHGRVFLVPCKKWLVQCRGLQLPALGKSLFTMCQKNTVMFIWSSCTTPTDLPQRQRIEGGLSLSFCLSLCHSLSTDVFVSVDVEVDRRAENGQQVGEGGGVLYPVRPRSTSRLEYLFLVTAQQFKEIDGGRQTNGKGRWCTLPSPATQHQSPEIFISSNCATIQRNRWW